MQPLKPFFLGLEPPPAPTADDRAEGAARGRRTTTSTRSGDGAPPTFFEMLGNFSFGDYFKDGAIDLA